MPRAKRKNPHDPAKLHDRRVQDLPHDAEVAAVEVDDPLAVESGEKIIALRSIRNDPLGRLHSHRRSTTRSTEAAAHSKTTGRRPSAGPGPSI